MCVRTYSICFGSSCDFITTFSGDKAELQNTPIYLLYIFMLCIFYYISQKYKRFVYERNSIKFLSLYLLQNFKKHKAVIICFMPHYVSLSFYRI